MQTVVRRPLNSCFYNSFKPKPLRGSALSGGQPWLSAVAAYHAVLFACSIAGLTPAPLIGYGAGPLLGFGLMVAVAGWAAPRGQRLDPDVRC